MVGAVTFDLFGTLVDFSVRRDEPPLVASLLEQTGVKRVPDAVLASWMNASLDERAKTPFRPIRDTLIVGAQAAFDEHGFQGDARVWADELERLWAHRDLFEDVEPALEALEQEGVCWAVVTNLDERVLVRVLERTGLDGFDPVVVSSERARAYKPHPRPFRFALEALGVEPGDVLHVGDRPGADRAGARAAGIRCRIVNRKVGETVLGVVEDLVVDGVVQ